MITSIELGNFISHSETKIDFDYGVTVFVGQNGAGKSSIIDAITFALFGEHTRKSNKSLIRRGTSQAYAKVNFSSNGKFYEAVRKIDAKGALSAQFFELQNGQVIPLAAGERKQFGESMTEQIESRLGLDFTKLKVASIVQQGELGSIIKAKPKEFKELLNAIIGIDKLDIASENLKLAQRKFRQTIQKNLGYDDSHITILANELTQKKEELKRSEPLKQELQNKKEARVQYIHTLKQQIDVDTTKETILKQLEERKSELIRYVKDAIISIQQEISEKERKIRDCQDCFEFANMKNQIDLELQQIESEIEKINRQIQEREKQKAITYEHQELAKRLQLQDGKCPVCESKVDKLKPVFQIEHLKNEQEKIMNEITILETKRQQLIQDKKSSLEKSKRATAAKATLDAHSIKNPEEIVELKNKINIQKSQIQKIPHVITTDGGLVEVSSIDSHTRILYEKIITLQKEIVGFDPQKFAKLKVELESAQSEISKIDQEYGAISEKITHALDRIKKIESILLELGFVKDYLAKVDEIQDNVYNRDGPVATSLRSWALTVISTKASEYLEVLNTKIHRIVLSEKARDITITCYSKNTIIDIDSLSGGEQVSVALALRLGMAHLLGSSNLNFIILDEPTTYLDAERRKSLVHVLSQLSDLSSNARGPIQFIIITHDAEIFEDSSVEKIYRFESSEDGTKVIPL